MFDKKSSFFGGSSSDSPESSGTDKDAPPDAFTIGRHDRLRDDQVTFRLKSVAGIGFLCLFLYSGYLTFFDDSRPPAQMQVAKAIEPIESYENRYADETRKKAGFFRRIFCRGLQRASFCQ